MDLDGLRKSLAGFSTRPFNVLANMATIAGLFISALSVVKFDATGIPVVYLCAVSLFLILRYVRQERWARYAEAAQTMDRAHRRLKEVTDRRVFGTTSQEDAVYSIQESLSAFAEAFTLVTGSDCRATLKEVYAEDTIETEPETGRVVTTKQLWVATVSRSDIDEARNVGREKPDLVVENTDFEYVVASRKSWHHGNLPKAWLDREYNNSHWLPELRTSRKFPYRSAIVWPVEVDRPGTARNGSRENGNDDVIALLCIDSKKLHAFRPRADIPFGSLYAHSLYPVLYFDRD